MTIPRGLIIYRGPSLLTGAPIVCVATGFADCSANTATGDMIQTYILVDGADPITARREGKDDAVCGDCPHRAGSCYVNLVQAPLAVHRGLERGIYPTFDPRRHHRLFRGRLLRMGSYGEPTALPLSVWRPLIALVSGHTGYTHTWRHCDQRWRMLLMASVDSEGERSDAKAMGWRTFRVRALDSLPAVGEIECPKSKRAGNRLTCAECLACDGSKASERAADVSIEPHGGASVMRRFHSLALAST